MMNVQTVSLRHVRARGRSSLHLALLAVAALSLLLVSAASADAASAPRWKVGGSFLPSTGTRNFTATNSTEFVMRVLNVMTVRTGAGNCSLNEAKIEGSGAGSSGKASWRLKCTGLKVDNFKECSVRSSDQAAGSVTMPMSASTVWLEQTGSARAGLLLKPATGTEFTKLLSEGECPLSGEVPLGGEVLSEVTPTGSESEAGAISLPSIPFSEGGGLLTYYSNEQPRKQLTSSGMWLGKNKVALSTQFKIELSPKQKFGIFAG